MHGFCTAMKLLAQLCRSVGEWDGNFCPWRLLNVSILTHRVRSERGMDRLRSLNSPKGTYRKYKKSLQLTQTQWNNNVFPHFTYTINRMLLMSDETTDNQTDNHKTTPKNQAKIYLKLYIKCMWYLCEGRAQIIVTPPPPPQIDGDELIPWLDVYLL